jgi:plastocyanin
MTRYLASFGSVAIVVAHLGSFSGAGGSLSGTVRVTGSPSNADAVVYLQHASGTFMAPAKPTDLDQRMMQFIPRVLPVVLGTTVRFLNNDSTSHNIFSPDNEQYNLGTLPQRETRTYTFNKCAKVPCVYTQFCHVHPEMEAYIVVLQNPFFGVSRTDGRYQIDDVPPGHYVVGMWHSKLIAQSKVVTIEAGKPAIVDF